MPALRAFQLLNSSIPGPPRGISAHAVMFEGEKGSAVLSFSDSQTTFSTALGMKCFAEVGKLNLAVFEFPIK